MSDRIRVALALGGGGARGYAHIGVIQALEERGCDIVGVSGTSMGALVGGLHAAGRLPPYAEWIRGLSQRDVIRLLDPSLRTPGVIRGSKVMARVIDLLAGVRIEDLPVPFTAVATDLLARKEVWFQRGPVEVAIRASIALPSVFTPVMLNGRLLADGGMMNPIPLAPLAAIRADATVAVSLSGVADAVPGRSPAQESSEPLPPTEWQARFRSSAAQLLDREAVRRVTGWFGSGRGDGAAAVAEELDVEAPEDVLAALPTGLGTLDVMELSLDALQSVVTRYRLASYPPDLLISIPKHACRTLDFHRGAEMMELGRKLADEALDRAPLTGGRQAGVGLPAE
ncbi:patatin family protein [Nocardioides koreensis]|uniref:Patatin family protein n=1 Tax=Nocardioides koreensis TaxID=433651 RepID=A0ABN3A6Q6_9ACTN